MTGVFLTTDDLFRLVRLLPALALGLTSVVLGFLLARRTRNPVFFAFAVLTLSFLCYAVSDFLTRFWWTHSGWNSQTTMLAGSAYLISGGWIIRNLVLFAGQLSGRPVTPLWRRLLWLPLALAMFASASLSFPFLGWTQSAFQTAGLAMLASLLLATIFTAARWFVLHQRIHDPTMRALARGTGILLLAFVPLWVLEAARVVQWGGFVWFFLVWNILATTVMARTQFQPSENEKPILFDKKGLETCATRFGLSAREIEITDMHARGCSSAEIGRLLFIAPKTVRNHVANIYVKTGVHQRLALTELLARYSEA